MTDVYVDRRGQLIHEYRWRELSNSPDYCLVRQYMQGGVPLEHAVSANIVWNGVKGRDFILKRNGMPTIFCDDELSAVSQYEDYLVSQSCGAWYPVAGTLDRNGRQQSTKFSFHSTNNILRHEVGQKISLIEIADSPDYGTW